MNSLFKKSSFILFALTYFISFNLPYAVAKDGNGKKSHAHHSGKKSSKKKKSSGKQNGQKKSNTEKKIAELARKKKFIWFYEHKTNPLTSFLGNFHPCKVVVAGYKFKCSEAAFQAAKFIHKPYIAKKFLKLNGHDAWKKAQEHARDVDPQWRQKNLGAMVIVVTEKFKNNPELKRLLLATGDAYLVEHTARDSFWGDGGNGSGQNMLGRILMNVRAQLSGKPLQNIQAPKEYYDFVNGIKAKKPNSQKASKAKKQKGKSKKKK